MAKIKTIAPFNPERANVLRATWGDGETTEWDMDNLTPEMRAHLAWHGLKQKTMDAHANVFKTTGSFAECRAASQTVWDHMADEDSWDKGNRASAGWIVEAVAEIFDIDVDDARETWDAMDEDTRKKVAKDPKIVAWKLRRDLARAEGAESEVDAAAMFGK